MRVSARHLGKLALLVTLSLPVAAAAQAEAGGPNPAGGQGPGGCPGCGQMHGMRGMRGARLYDPKTVTTVQGEVLDVQRLARRHHEGVVLTVAVGSEKLPVHLGPGFYVDSQSVKIAKGDRIEVKGSRVTFAGGPALIAQEIRKGDQVLPLRDENGLPLWSRGRSGARR